MGKGAPRPQGSVASIGASPVFVVDPVTYNMDPADLERAIAEVEAEGWVEGIYSHNSDILRRLSGVSNRSERCSISKP